MAEQNVIAYFWFRNAEDFEELRSISEDSTEFLESYSSWLERTQAGIDEVLRRSPRAEIMKVAADPADYLAWCREHSQLINGASRIAYANFKAMELKRGSAAKS